MTQFVDNENLSKNTLLEIDVAEMTESHLTVADKSCGQSVSTLPHSVLCGLYSSVCLSVCYIRVCVHIIKIYPLTDISVSVSVE